jgi:hypothetical protein
LDFFNRAFRFVYVLFVCIRGFPALIVLAPIAPLAIGMFVLILINVLAFLSARLFLHLLRRLSWLYRLRLLCHLYFLSRFHRGFHLLRRFYRSDLGLSGLDCDVPPAASFAKLELKVTRFLLRGRGFRRWLLCCHWGLCNFG